MRQRIQTKRLISYLGELLFWTVVVAIMYKALAFKTVPGFSLAQSNLLFWGLAGVTILFNILLIPPQKRNDFNIFLSVNTPLAVYFIVSFSNIYTTLIKISVFIICVIFVGFIGLAIYMNAADIKNGKYKHRFFIFVKGIAAKGRVVLCLGLSVLFLLFHFNQFLGGPLMDAKTVATDPKVNNQKISANIDTILLLQEDEWAVLSIQERLDVLQTVANIEATYLGLPHELNVVIDVTGEYTAGHYNDGVHEITINPDVLADSTAHEAVEILAHEAYHAYEHRLVDLYNNVSAQERNLLIFGRIEEYRDNFEHYIDGNEDIYGYLFQAVELDSDKYAIAAIEDYYSAIDDYLNPDENEE